MKHMFHGPRSEGDCEEHTAILETLVRRLEPMNYDLVATNLHYQVGNKEGEIDVLTRRNGVYHFYEVKSGKRKFNKARDQFYRFRDTHPDIECKGIYVSDNEVKRIR